jgi:hypothetical protein
MNLTIVKQGKEAKSIDSGFVAPRGRYGDRVEKPGPWSGV